MGRKAMKDQWPKELSEQQITLVLLGLSAGLRVADAKEREHIYIQITEGLVSHGHLVIGDRNRIVLSELGAEHFGMPKGTSVEDAVILAAKDWCKS